MELNQIKTYLDSTNPQERMKGIVELRNHTPEVVVPLLKERMHDEKFIVRSFVAMGLGNKRTDEGFEALVHLIEQDKDPNVRAEASNSLAKYGSKGIPHLVKLFERDTHWLVRQSIFAAMEEMNRPDVMFQLCRWGIEGEDLVVKGAAIANLGQLQKTTQALEALEILLSLVTAEPAFIRIKVVKALRNFDDPRAKAALIQLRQDGDHRVVAATLEAIL
ncbi:MAG: HEAT repeat domain-containing protein [Nostocaceae cyanobacterium]|nr:HEAT repeat domain-containing protein [Nostocaceae cyanobacterium]